MLYHLDAAVRTDHVVVEEVLFRGALDAYLHETDTDEGTFSAYYVSTLWALWHLPLTLAVVGFAGVPGQVIHLFIGVPLSMAMRRGRNLARAWPDALRNQRLPQRAHLRRASKAAPRRTPYGYLSTTDHRCTERYTPWTMMTARLAACCADA